MFLYNLKIMGAYVDLHAINSILWVQNVCLCFKYSFSNIIQG